AVTVKDGSLEVEVIHLLLIGQNLVGRIFRLVLVELGGIECRPSINPERRRLTRIIRNLEVAMVPADEKNEPAGVVKNVGRIAEHFVLVGVVMNRVAASSRILDADAVVQVIR